MGPNVQEATASSKGNRRTFNAVQVQSKNILAYLDTNGVNAASTGNDVFGA